MSYPRIEYIKVAPFVTWLRSSVNYKDVATNEGELYRLIHPELGLAIIWATIKNGTMAINPDLLTVLRIYDSTRYPCSIGVAVQIDCLAKARKKKKEDVQIIKETVRDMEAAFKEARNAPAVGIIRPFDTEGFKIRLSDAVGEFGMDTILNTHPETVAEYIMGCLTALQNLPLRERKDAVNYRTEARQLTDKGYYVISLKYKTVARLDRRDWKEVIARQNSPWSLIEGMRDVENLHNPADIYRRVFSKDKKVLSSEVLKEMLNSIHGTNEYVEIEEVF